MRPIQKTLPSLASNSIHLAVLLGMVGGFLDAYTFISRDGVFANAQTGNIVLFAVHLATGEWRNALVFIPPIVAFIIGVLVSEVVKLPFLRELLYSYRRSILILECLVLIIVGFLPASMPNIIVTTSLAFVSSLQISTFNKLDKWAYNSTMTTGSLRTATQAAYAAFIYHDAEAKKQFKQFFVIIISFLVGALLGTFTTTYIGNKSIWVAAGVLVIALVLYHRDKGYIRKSAALTKHVSSR
ncbi:YoaK family protein [Niallia sp. NCCP-28]|uniref:YoaK family protein n=1 Tax=Niallia sp. NCCP-28 TaxID=2934712 RepID=UPI00208A92EB|nr:YoaK family protein [Niallia sp. NCCP-28]GKU83079.1 DUF1275 family protein [Niallia sp. NCCP-28]